MEAWEDRLPPLIREKLARIGQPTPEEKARMKELDNLDSVLGQFFKGDLDSESLFERLKEYERQGKQFLLTEARARLKSSFKSRKLRIEFEELGDGRLSVHLLEEEKAEEGEETEGETNLVIELTSDNFDPAVRKHRLLVVDCWAEWCAPCRIVAPVVEQLARDYRGKITFGKLNVDKNQSLALRYGIMSIPTLLVFKDGELVDQVVGAMPRGALESQLARHIQDARSQKAG
jgi:thioredoxin 1